MMFKNNKSLAFVVALAGMVGMAMHASALPDVNFKKSGKPLLKSAAGCKEAQQAIDMDINNVTARVMTGGDMWYDRGTGQAAYEIPKGSNKNSLFAGSSWIGGYDAQGQLKVAAQTYRQNGNDYWPGPLDPTTASIDGATCSEWDRFWKINRSTVNAFKEIFKTNGDLEQTQFLTIKEWPAKGNIYAKGNNGNSLNILTTSSFNYAPFVDLNGDGVYNFNDGDYPDITGDQYLWWVFNDKGNIKGETKTDAIGLEVQTSAFAYSTKDALNDASFYIYRIINRGPLTMDSTYMATWTDADLGYAFDDYIGCDTVRGLGIEYNGSSIDGSGGPGTYGNHVPMVGVDFFKGPHKYIRQPDGTIKDSLLSMQAFTYFNNDASAFGNPTNGIEIYNYMTGSDRRGEIFNNDFQGPGIVSTATTAGPKTRFVFFGDPESTSGWSECNCGNPVGDRRFIHSAGAFQLIPGAVNDLIIGSCWVADVGGCPNTSFKKIRAADDIIQSLFDAGFRTTEGPEAPRVVIREMDRKLIFYMYNDPASNNYKEQYGYVDSQKYRVPSTKAKNYVHAADSLYKFEGYRVFQLKTTEVGPGQIYNSDGSINTEVAAEVFQCDIRNGITRIVNYNKVPDISDSTWQAVVRVEGRDSGIVHSFEMNTDAFAAGDDKRLVNYRNYHYVVIAYAYNNFAPFNPRPLKSDSTQDVPYLESLHGPNGTTISVLHPMPNPANGDMGTVLNADYGSGVIIHKLEGIGNGGNILDIDEATEQGALNDPGGIIASKEIVYKAGAGPVDIKIADPQKVKAVNWELFLKGDVDAAKYNRLKPDANSGWTLVNLSTNETIYSEQSLQKINEQLVADYGLSITVAQAPAPYEDEPSGNGYLTSLVIYDDPTKPWLAGVVNNTETNSFLAVLNWIRTGNNRNVTTPFRNCNFTSFKFDTVGAYANMFANTTLTKSTWAPYALASIQSSPQCQFGVAYPGSVNANVFINIRSVDLVFTSDKSKWSRVAVIEEQGDRTLSEGGASQFKLRSHRSWNGEVNSSGGPVYSDNPADTGMSYFPGYAIDQETGARLNIVFGEDSYLRTENGGDMIWNPTYTILNDFSGDPIFGGKHYIYISSAAYDGDASFANVLKNGSSLGISSLYQQMMWVGLPTINPSQKLLPLKDNLIPTTTRLKFRVSRPYALNINPAFDNTNVNGGRPHYQFSTADLAPSKLSDNENDKTAVLKRINVTPNPYYGYTAYEGSRLDTRVRIINLPHKATVHVYSLDGTLIRTLTKDDANTSYIDWDVRNAKGLPIASGMYLIHVNAEGIGETVLRWFGAMRPLDITAY